MSHVEHDGTCNARSSKVLNSVTDARLSVPNSNKERKCFFLKEKMAMTEIVYCRMYFKLKILKKLRKVSVDLTRCFIFVSESLDW